MKNLLLYLSLVISLIAIAMVMYQYREMNRLSIQLQISMINSEFQQIVKATEQERSYEFDCVIRINEHFGEHAKWNIEVNGLQHQIVGPMVTLFHARQGGISRSWFPPRSNPASGGGAGYSVSTDEESYSFELVSRSKGGRAAALLSGLMQVCAEQDQAARDFK